jgi:hypothetical protein
LLLASSPGTAQAVVDGPPQPGLWNLFCENELRLCGIQFAKAGKESGGGGPEVSLSGKNMGDNL